MSLSHSSRETPLEDDSLLLAKCDLTLFLCVHGHDVTSYMHASFMTGEEAVFGSDSVGSASFNHPLGPMNYGSHADGLEDPA